MHPAMARRWGRYRQRLAAGHAASGRREDALRHATAAVRHLQHGAGLPTELFAACEIIATCQQELGQLEAAVAARQSASDILERTAPGTTASTLALVKLGDLFRFQGRFDQAEEIVTRALAGASTDADGDEPPVRALVLNALGIVYKDTGRYHDAEVAYIEALELITTTCGPDDPAAATLWHNIAGLAHARGQADQAATSAARAVEIRERALGPDHHFVAQDLAVQGAALLEIGRTAEAEELFGRALAIFRARHPADHYDVAVNLSNLAACRLQRNDGVGAEPLFRQGLSIKQAIFGDHHPEIARQLNNLAVAVAAQHRHNEATDLHRQALSIAQNTLPANHPLTHTCLQNVTIGDADRLEREDSGSQQGDGIRFHE
jgi:tetratricopeptide (TPR) repeat protein